MPVLTRFAFIIHPIHAKDAGRKYPIMRLLPDPLIERLMLKLKTKKASDITGIVSLAGAKTEGVFMGIPMTPRMMLAEQERATEEIIKCAELAAAEGCEIIGLGAYSAIVGDAGITAAKRSPIAVTTGNSYTVATAIQGAFKAAALVGIVPEESVLAVVGATGSIGRTCAMAMAPRFARTIVVGRDMARTQPIAGSLPRAEAHTSVEAIPQADVIVSVTSAENAVIEPHHLKPGAVVCDVSRPRDVSVRVARERPDVLVIEGGVVKVPGPVEFNFDFGFPRGTAYACMSETMLLALEGRPESYTLGKEVSLEQVNETTAWAEKHGFELAGFRAFEKEVDSAAIERVKAARRSWADESGSRPWLSSKA